MNDKNMVKLHCYVTCDDILNGQIGIASSCPIAHALKRRLEETPTVGRKYANLFAKRDKSYRTKLPEKACDFIEKFDGRNHVKPMRFTIRVRKECLK